MKSKSRSGDLILEMRARMDKFCPPHKRDNGLLTDGQDRTSNLVAIHRQ
jgi:hypothetical protein